MPIKGLSEQRRLPRLGKIHLGVKVTKNKKGEECSPYPRATEYFVCPDEVMAVYGEKPQKLEIIIPVEDEEMWANQYYRKYSRSRGLVCKGDGITCRRMVDVGTGDTANRDTTQIVWKEGQPCAGRECPDYQAKKCQEVMNLQFLLPKVPGIGVWQIDTGSINSIRNINNMAAMIRATCDRISWIPLVLTLEPVEVTNPDDGKKKTVRCLNLRHEGSLGELLLASGKAKAELLITAPAEDEAPMDEAIETSYTIKPKATSSTTSPAKNQSNSNVSKPDTEQAEKDVEKMWPEDLTHAKEVAVKPELGAPPTDEAIDMDWLKESLKKLRWMEKTAATWLTGKFKVEGGLLKNVIPRLTKEQQEEFVKEIQDRLKMV